MKKRVTNGAGGERETRVSEFARRVLAEWRRLELPVEGRVVLAASGGGDSTALLLACAELAKAGRLPVGLLAAHLEHGLRGEEGEQDASWVAELASKLGVECVVGRGHVRERAGAGGDNLEQAARRARYEFLSATASGSGARVVLTAHTLDDQAETVLLRLLRGSGAEGLGGIRPLRQLEASGEAGVEVEGAAHLSSTPSPPSLLLARPLVRWARRAETEEFCRGRGVEARVDEMNLDERFARVRVRRRLLPELATYNPRVVEMLGRTAELLGDDAAALEAEAERLLNDATDLSAPESSGNKMPPSSSPPLLVGVLAGASKALRRRALRLWIGRGRGGLRRVEMAHVVALEKLLEGEKGGRVAQLPGGDGVVRHRRWLVFRPGSSEKS